MRFENRKEAGLKLAEELLKYKDEDVVVLAVPRGGLPVGAMIAKTLNAPLDVALAKKIGHPYNPEYAIGAVSLKDRVLNEGESVPEAYIEEETTRIREELKRRYRKFHEGRARIDLRDKVVILVDDGMATGNTIRALTAVTRQEKPSKIVVALPVASPSALRKLERQKEVDEVVCLQSPRGFRAVGQYYGHFYQVSDEEAVEWLKESRVT